jgi:hypothetical protein
MRRVGVWHIFHIEAVKKQIADLNDSSGNQRFQLGFRAVLNLNRCRLEQRYEGFSHWFKSGNDGIDLRGLRLGSV